MGSVLHANAKTTPRIRKEIQASKESLSQIAKRYNINIKTAQKWKNAKDINDKRPGPQKPKGALTDQEQAIICEFRRVTKLPLDDVFCALKERIPALTRSNLHRCLVRHKLNVLPKEQVDEREKKAFKDYPIGYVHIDITEVRTQEGKCYLFVGVDRASKYVYAEIYEHQTIENGVKFLNNMIEHCVFKITKILTDNGSQFTYELLAEHLKPKNKIHPFDEVCQKNNIEHRLTQFRHPWTNGQVEVTNRILKQYTTKNYYYEDLNELKKHMHSFLMFYNHQRKLKSLKYQTPYDIIEKNFDKNPSDFKDNPNHKIVGLNK